MHKTNFISVIDILKYLRSAKGFLPTYQSNIFQYKHSIKLTFYF